MKRQKTRNQRGVNAAEFAAVLAFGLPLLTILVLVTLECTRFFTIKSAMEVGARNAARALAIDYNKTHTQNGNGSLTWLRIPHYIQNNSAFQVSWDPNPNPEPKYVTVTCTYLSGQNGLPVFPAGPLTYLSPKSTFSFGNIQVQGTFTQPVQ